MSRSLGPSCAVWGDAPGTTAIVLATGLIALLLPRCGPAQENPVDSVYAGDTVVIAKDGVELGLKDQLATVLNVGDRLRVTEVRGVWIGGYAIVQDQRYSGWVHRREVRLAGAEPGAVARIEVPDQADDPQAVAALKALEVKLELNRAGNVVAADATASRLEDAGLLHFAKLHQLAILDLSGRPISDTGLAALARAKVLQELYLNDTQVTDQSLRLMVGLPNLEILAVGTTAVTGAGLVHLKNLPSLQVLNLHGCKISDAQLKPLSDMPQLEVLVLSETQVTSQGLSYLTPIRRLRVLNLIGCPVDDTGLPHLKPLENLRMLYVEQTEVTEEGAEELNQDAPSLAIFR